MAEHSYPSARATLAVLHVLFAAVIVYAFFITLMTASVQQRILPLLPESMDYSRAYLLYTHLPDAADRQKAEAAAAVAAQAVSAAEQRTDRAGQLFSTKAAAFEPLRHGAAAQACGASGAAGRVIEDWQALQDCRNLPTDQQEALARLSNETPSLPRAYNSLALANAELDFAMSRERDAQDALKEINDSIRQGAAIKSAFSEVEMLRGYWTAAKGIMAGFPPPMLQIILAFFSGCFGALLIALVLLVYPDYNELALTRGKGYEARIVLGGLIAVCVYVILGSGAVLLGDAAALSSGKSNVMTLCGVGVLAGMFSDRVAAWLSDRADTFLRGRSEEEAKNEAGPRQAA